MTAEEDKAYPARIRKNIRGRPKSAMVPGFNKHSINKRDLSDFHNSKSAGRLKNNKIVPQNSSSITTDKTGAALESINNILNGITASVNRLTELQHSIPNPPTISLPSAKQPVVRISQQPSEERGSSKPPLFRIKALRKRVQTLAAKLPSVTSSRSNSSIRKPGKMSGKVSDKKIQKPKAMERMNTEIIDQRGSTSVKKRLKPYTKTHVDRHYGGAVTSGKNHEFAPHKLVEIYHNTAAKESDSEEEKNRARVQMKTKSIKIPPLQIPCQECGDCKDAKNCNHVHDNAYEESNAPRSFYNNRNYELPTIASKMKQAVRMDFNMFNFKAIPFCPVSSTTPSHNIGINIQQVMSIIKTRQPVQGISPTLAHNINLAAEKLNHDPLTSFVSSITSKMGYGRSGCPLNKYSLNFRHLEEMARSVPEEATEDCDVPNEVGGASGDMNSRAPPGPYQWTSDGQKRSCTCAPASGVDFQQVYNKYHPSSFDQKTHYSRNPSSAQSFGCREAVSKRSKPGTGIDGRYQQNADVYAQNNFDVTPLTGKEKNLKEVLMNLHDDFEDMNKKYESLSNVVNAGVTSNEKVEELQQLELQLKKKEEEINIVMTLYKEVQHLKQQVRELVARNGGSNISNQYRPENYSSKTAQHIMKLLQQVQFYSTYYRNGHNGYLNM